MLDFDALLAQAALPEEVVPVCLDGRLARRYEELKTRLDDTSADSGDTRLAGHPGGTGRAELDELAGQVQAKTVPFLLRAMPRDRFIEFLAAPEHKARTVPGTGETDPRDTRMGVNTAVFVPALVRASIAEPELTPERWDNLSKVLSSAQLGRLFSAAWSINSEDREVPFSPGGSPSPRS